MPDFEITSPDGRKFIVTAPEGASQDDVLRYAQQNMPAAPQRGYGESILRGIRLAGQGFNNALGATAGAIPDAVGAGLRAVGLPSSEPGQYTRFFQRNLNALGGNDVPETPIERNVMAAGEGAGNAASVFLPAKALQAMTQVGGLANNVFRALGSQPAAQAGTAASNLFNSLRFQPATQAGNMATNAFKALGSQPVTQLASGAVGGSVGQATDSPLAGAAAALGTGVAMNAPRLLGARASAMNPEETRLRDVMMANNVPLTPGQATQSTPLRSMESVFRKLPMTAGPQERVAQTQREAFNRYWLQQAGADDSLATPSVIQGLRDRWGGVIGNIADRNTLRATQGFVDDVQRVMDEAKEVLVQGTEKPIVARARSILAKVDSDGKIPGSTYRVFDTEIGKAIKETTAPDVRSRLEDLRRVVREAMDASISPDDAAAWNEARRRYAITMSIKEARDSGIPMAARGNIPPTQISRTITRNYGRGFGADTSPNRDMAAAGRLFIGDNIPDPGTANQLFYQNLATGGLAGGAGLASGADFGTMALTTAGLLGIPRALQGAYNTQAARNYFTAQPGQYLPGLLNVGIGQARPLLERR